MYRGIGFEICGQLAYKGMMVVLTVRDAQKGQNALQQHKKLVHYDNLIFHQLKIMTHSALLTLLNSSRTKLEDLIYW